MIRKAEAQQHNNEVVCITMSWFLLRHISFREKYSEAAASDSLKVVSAFMH